MFNRDDKNFYKVLTENYHEEEFRSCDITDSANYQHTMRQIIKMQKDIAKKHPELLDDLNDLGDLYSSLNEIKTHYFYEEGVMFAVNLLLPCLISKESTRLSKILAAILKSTWPDPTEDSDEDFVGDDEEGEDEEDE